MGQGNTGAGGGGDSGKPDDALSALGALVGDEVVTTDVPRSTDHPTRSEQVALDRRVTERVAHGWGLWMEQTFAAAREICERGVHAYPGRAPLGRQALLGELEMRRPGTATSPGLLALLREDALLSALVDAVIVVDEFVAHASSDGE